MRIYFYAGAVHFEKNEEFILLFPRFTLSLQPKPIIKTITMRKFFMTLLAVLPMLAAAQVTKNITVQNAGELSNQITENEKLSIVSLTVSGPLNGNDVKLLQQIVNRSKASEKKGEYLTTSLDLSDAVILEGKEGIKLKANELPDGCFAGAKGLVTVKLPDNLTVISKNCRMIT